VGRMVAYGVAYALAIVVGRLIVLPETNLALFWPAAGVGALWALVTPSRRQLAVVAATIWVLSSAGLALTGIPADAAVVLGLANVVNSVGTAVGYSWLTAQSTAEPVEWHGGGAAPLRRLSDVGRFTLAAAVATTVSGVVGMVGLAVGDTAVTSQTALGWLLRNGAAIVIIAGTGLAMRGQAEIVSRRHLVEAVPVLLVSLVVLWLVFGPGRTISLSFLPLAVLVWGGLRLPVPLAALQGATTALVTLGLVVVTSGSPFGDIGDIAGQALTLQAFMMLATLLSLVLSTVQWERDALVSEAAAVGLRSRRQAEDLRVITETIPDALIVMDREGKVLLHNEAARRWLAPSRDDEDELDAPPVVGWRRRATTRTSSTRLPPRRAGAGTAGCCPSANDPHDGPWTARPCAASWWRPTTSAPACRGWSRSTRCRCTTVSPTSRTAPCSCCAT
jgi:integral membrane sensor domain MASE1